MLYSPFGERVFPVSWRTESDKETPMLGKSDPYRTLQKVISELVIFHSKHLK